MIRPQRLAWLLLLLALPLVTPPARGDEPFYLKDGDRVVFYGDSITDQRLYTTFVETFVVTRFPKRDITFVHSGWGGDRVTGGGGGGVDERLKRDVFAYKPTVVTVMLGMNDASYKAFDPKIFETYSKGYEHIVEAVKANNPDVRMTLIRPSPFDDVTREPKFDGGYNAVLVRYGDFIEELAKKNHLDVADLNGPVVEATKKAFADDPRNAEKLNPDRVHPGPGGQLLMAAALLKAWHAPAVVSKVAVRVEGDSAKADATNTEVTEVKASNGSVSWTQRDEALPFPIDQNDSVVKLAVRSSDVVESLDEQPLEVAGLASGNYTLTIDGKTVGTFSADDLGKGVNLATRSTPMTEQASRVHGLTLKHNDIHFTRWRQFQVPPVSDDPALVSRASDALDAVEADLVKKQHAEAQPRPRKYELSRKP